MEVSHSMGRQPVHIRDATPDDAEVLLRLWSRTTRHCEASPQAVRDAEQALANAAADPDGRLLVAQVEGQVVAALQLTRGPVSPLVLDSAVHTSYLLVEPEHRKHGVAHALMEAAVLWAEEKDVHQITAITDTNRDTNRFFVRLGMSTLATVRSVPTAALRKKLSSERTRPAGNRHLGEVLAQRRSMRRRQDRG
jgi:GNAT superfamily N-acetyltransferase